VGQGLQAGLPDSKSPVLTLLAANWNKEGIGGRPPNVLPTEKEFRQPGSLLYVVAHLLSPKKKHWALRSTFVAPSILPLWFTCVVAPSQGWPRAVIFPQVSKVPVALVFYQAQDLLPCEIQRHLRQRGRDIKTKEYWTQEVITANQGNNSLRSLGAFIMHQVLTQVLNLH
jgi:hypothetical protein